MVEHHTSCGIYDPVGCCNCGFPVRLSAEKGPSSELETLQAKVAKLEAELKTEVASAKILAGALTKLGKDADVLKKQVQASLPALQFSKDSTKDIMEWCVKNVHKWDFPLYDNLDLAYKKMDEVILEIEKET